MSEPEHQQRASELARLWQGQVVPVEDEAATLARRERVIPSIGAVIGQAAASRRRTQRLRKAVAVLSVAAGVVCAVGFGRYLSHRDHGATSPAASRAHWSGVRAISGTVTLMNGAGPTNISLASLEIGDAVSTGLDARAELKLTDLVVAEIGASSEVSMVTPSASTHRLRLDRGRIQARVDDHPSAMPKLVVETPNADVVVTGTVFQVEVAAGRSPMESVTVVSVTKGRVVVRHGADDVAAVTAGHSWSSAGVSTTPHDASPDTATQRVGAHAGHVTGARPHAVRPGTLAEENALFQSAVDARNGGDDHAEADRLGALLGRYPGSPLAGEARVERMRALQRTGQAFEAAREARRYLAEYPDGFARDEARRLVMQDGASNRPAP